MCVVSALNHRKNQACRRKALRESPHTSKFNFLTKFLRLFLNFLIQSFEEFRLFLAFRLEIDQRNENQEKSTLKIELRSDFSLNFLFLKILDSLLQLGNKTKNSFCFFLFSSFWFVVFVEVVEFIFFSSSSSKKIKVDFHCLLSRDFRTPRLISSLLFMRDKIKLFFNFPCKEEENSVRFLFIQEQLSYSMQKRVRNAFNQIKWKWLSLLSLQYFFIFKIK